MRLDIIRADFLRCGISPEIRVLPFLDWKFLPKVKGVFKEDGSILAPPIEEMSPLVSIEELNKEMIVKLSKKSTQIKR